jgi:uncharacterized membrane protein
LVAALGLIRFVFGGIGLAALAALALIALNLAQFGDISLTRFRGPTYALWIATGICVCARTHPRRAIIGIARRVHDVLLDRRFFWVMATSGLILYVLAALTQYLSFHVSSHDLSIFDESLYNTVRGRFMYSQVLDRCFFSEHFSPVLLVLLPMYAVAASPPVLVLVHALILWAAVLVLRAAVEAAGLGTEIQNLTCLVYLSHPIAVKTLNYAFHVEAMLPVAFFAAYLFYRRNQHAAYWICLLFLLGVKEDVGLYVVGFGLYLALGEKRRRVGGLTAAAGLAWTWLTVSWVIPAFDVAGWDHMLASRWGHWGSSPAGVVWGWLTHPLVFLLSLLNTKVVKYLACLLFLPFAGRWTWLLVAMPWVLNATSALQSQRQLDLHYGVPLLAFGLVASIEALRGPAGRSLTVRAWAPVLVAAAVVFNVAHFTYPEIPRCRPKVLDAIRSIPEGSRIAAMPCLYPVLSRTADRTLLLPGAAAEGEYELIRVADTTWPFTPDEIQDRVRRLLASRRWEVLFEEGGFVILRRVEGSHGLRGPDSRAENIDSGGSDVFPHTRMGSLASRKEKITWHISIE